MPGTLDFMPPEALSVKPRYGNPVDMFSLGCVACHVISHQWPEPKDRVAELENGMIALTEIQRREEYLEVCTELSLKQLVESCLHNKPEKRPEISSVCQDLKLIDAKLTNQASSEAVVQLKNNQMQELQHNVQAMAVNEQPEPLEKVSDLMSQY